MSEEINKSSVTESQGEEICNNLQETDKPTGLIDVVSIEKVE